MLPEVQSLLWLSRGEKDHLGSTYNFTYLISSELHNLCGKCPLF